MDRRKFLKVFGTTTTLFTGSVFADPFISDKDIYISKKELPLFVSIVKKLNNAQRIIGYKNFTIISFDKLLYYARNYSQIGAFSKSEIAFIEKMFYEDPKKYHFFGKRTVKNLTDTIDKKHIAAIPKTGQYLFKEHSKKIYEQMIKDVDNIYLTSGIRSVVKQMKLQFNKIYAYKGNITKATFSIAPIGYSYHSIGDFDVGKIGWGAKNFTASFGDTNEYKYITKLKYIKIRYTKHNKDGIRYEPWHMKIV